MFVVRFIVNFCISFIILSIPVNGKAIFNHLYQLTSSVASKNIEAIKEKSKSFFSTKSEMRKNIHQKEAMLGASAPDALSLSPSYSPLELSEMRNEKENVDGESYTDEEREDMRRVFESSHP